MMRYPLRRGTAVPVMVEYTDGEGDRSLRKVMPTGLIIGDGPRTPDRIYLHARCTVARGPRTFRLDRVQGLSDPATGEVFPPGDWIATRSLGDGRPFAWSDDEHDEQVDAQAVAPVAPVRSRWAVWRVAFYALLVGYLIGRLRLLHALLHFASIHQARWL